MLLLLLVLLIGFPTAAHAYVDPGTTTSVFGLIATIVSGAGVIGAFLVRPVLRLFRRKKKDAPHDTPPTPPAA